MKLTPHEAMSLAIQEGKRGAGFVSPNPCVGCVILDAEGNLIGQGYHQKFGEAHAEINALKSITDSSLLKGAQVFVTLEPCAHQGKTGSCAQALAQLPIASVTYGLIDPFPEVAGKGAEILKKAGIRVQEFGELKPELKELCEVFLHNVLEKKPFVALKVASSLDGQIAMASGESQWITGPGAREHVQYLRGCYDAVLVGANTLIKDNPKLNSRHPNFISKRSRVVVLDPSGRAASMLSKSELLKVRSAQDVILVTAKQMSTPCEILIAPLNSDGQFELDFVLRELKNRGIHSLFVEGGAYAVSIFLKQRQAQRIFLFLAPKILGEGLGWSTHLRLENLADGIVLGDTRIEKCGEDFLFAGRIQA